MMVSFATMGTNMFKTLLGWVFYVCCVIIAVSAMFALLSLFASVIFFLFPIALAFVGGVIIFIAIYSWIIKDRT